MGSQEGEDCVNTCLSTPNIHRGPFCFIFGLEYPPGDIRRYKQAGCALEKIDLLRMLSFVAT
jgi:hypothetical protein